jgi:hypothetical protein
MGEDPTAPVSGGDPLEEDGREVALARVRQDGDDVGWRRLVDTALASPEDARSWVQARPVGGPSLRVEPRSVVVLGTKVLEGARSFRSRLQPRSVP